MTKEQVKEQIRLLNEYFVIKLLNGDYEVKGVTEYIVKLVIDGEHRFDMWIGNDEKRLRVTSLDNEYLLNLTFTEEEQHSIFKDLKTIQNDKFTKSEIAKLTEKLTKLKRSVV